jgi:hypothetical protein
MPAHRLRPTLLTLAATAAATAVLTASAHAAVIPVTNTNDTGADSLRAALSTANGTVADDVIDITVPGTINLTSTTLPAVAPTATGGKLTIQGLGAQTTTVNRAYGTVSAVFAFQFGSDATITGLSITNGAFAGVLAFGTLKLDRVEVRGNSSSSAGGGILSGNGADPANLTIDRSTVTGNSSMLQGGGVFNNTIGTLTITRSTIQGNTSTGPFGGGVASSGLSTSITGSTIAGNTVAAPAGANSGNLDVEVSTLQLRDSVIADPLSSTVNPTVNCRAGNGGSIASQGFNLADDSSCSLSNPNDRPVADPGLAPLVGLSPKVLPIAPSSPAADKIPAASCGTATDQRGIPRPQGGSCDIGAYELEALPPLPFRNPATIIIPASGAATPFPSEIAVSGLQGTVTGVSVRLDGLVHSFPTDLGALLVAPGGQAVELLADAGSSNDVNGVTLTFEDAGAVAPSVLTTGTFAPFNGAPDPVFAAPAPAGPWAATLSTLVGTSPNGTWKLFVEDFSGGDSGRILSGWALDVRTPAPPATTPTNPGTNPPSKAPAKCKKKKKKGKKAGASAKCKKKKKPKKK